MPQMIFVNLPVKDLERSKRFFTALGFTFNPDFTDENAACLVISEHIYSMLIVEPFFRTFTSKNIAVTATDTEVILSLTHDSRADVDRRAEAAIVAGGTESRDPSDQGFMYTRQIQDPDGHLWEFFHMAPPAG